MIIVNNSLTILIYILGCSSIFKILVKTFENNGKNISKSIVKLNLEQKILLYNHLVYICAEERDFWQFYDNCTRWDWELTLTQFTVKGHNWVSLAYCDFNIYLVITMLIHKFKTTGWLQGHLILWSFRDWSNEYHVLLDT